jgi:cytoskeletal protein RodZ
VTVGESLTEARHQAGLSVDELSERTRIRGTVIRSIERDDYDACGGELYVRGYVRAIAGAVGIDAQPLIREYDQDREVSATDAFGAGLDATRLDLKPFPGDPEATSFDLPPVGDDRSAGEDLMAAGYDLPQAGAAASAGPDVPVKRARPAHAGPAGEEASTGRRRRGRGLLVGVAALVVLAVAGLVAIHLAFSSTTSRNTAATSAPLKASSAPVVKTSAPAEAVTPVKTAKPKSTRRAPRVLAVTALPVAAAEAFGPDGLADGDNPSTARYAITGDAPLPWSTQWYATPAFGMLKHGTGLLLDLGQRETITSVRLDLSPGANMQLRVGNGTSPSDLVAAATVTNTGGALRLTLRHPASARYLLIWFTLLPPNVSGQYEESVSHVLVNGRR